MTNLYVTSDKIGGWEGGAKVTFHGNGQNGRLISNAKKLVVPDVPPAPLPFNGQFVQVNVVDVVEAK